MSSLITVSLKDFTSHLFCNLFFLHVSPLSVAWRPLRCRSTGLRAAEDRSVLLLSVLSRCFASSQTDLNINSTFSSVVHLLQTGHICPPLVLWHVPMQTSPCTCVSASSVAGTGHCTGPACPEKEQHVRVHHLPKTFAYEGQPHRI